MTKSPQTTAVPPSVLSQTTPANAKPSPPVFPEPKLRLEIRDLSHAGAKRALTSLDLSTCISNAVQNVLRHLYTSPSTSGTHVPSTRSVTFIFRDMGGVAHTIGSELDDDHKEIHVSLGYIKGIGGDADRAAHEIDGVITHELVHCFQYNGHGACPGGLIEGIADWVRLQCKLAPPHWDRKAKPESWDAGYQHTAYFLDYVEQLFGEGSVQKINEKLRTERYIEESFWTGLFGAGVEELFEAYCSMFE